MVISSDPRLLRRPVLVNINLVHNLFLVIRVTHNGIKSNEIIYISFILL